jgi:hypothetical protein
LEIPATPAARTASRVGKYQAMDCMVAAASISASGSLLQLAGVTTVALDLIASGRLPHVRAMVRRFLRQSPRIINATAELDQATNLGDAGGGVDSARVEIEAGDVPGQLRELERRIDEVRTATEREASSRAEADARLERSIQEQLQSLQNELTELRHDLASDKAREKSRAGIAWAGIAGFSIGLVLNVVGAVMAVQCGP